MTTKFNDFVIRFANVNGSGSASANGMFAKALFRMGIPVATRNIFPSNIQGLPTWFEVRVSEQGYLGRREGVDIMVAMNAETFAEDIASILPGGYLLYDNSKPLPQSMARDDIHEIGIPIANMMLPEFADPKQRSLFKNITYLGAMAGLLNIEFDVITGMVATQYKGKDALIEPNIRALELGRDYALEYLQAPLPLQVRRLVLARQPRLLRSLPPHNTPSDSCRPPIPPPLSSGTHGAHEAPEHLRLQRPRLWPSPPLPRQPVRARGAAWQGRSPK